MSTPQAHDPTQPDVPGKRRKVSNLQAHREQKERMAEINEIADSVDFNADPDWTPEATTLEAAGWIHQTVLGKRIWQHDDFGLWKSEESAYYLQTHLPPIPDLPTAT